MKLSGVLEWARWWLLWVALPPPWWVVGSFVAAVWAVWLCIGPSPWAPASSVFYQIAGAVLAVWQFVSLQNGLHQGADRGWLTREVREWWAKRPVRRHHVLSGQPASISITASAGSASVWPGAGTSHDEQLRIIWDKLKTLTADMGQMSQEMRQKHDELRRRIEEHHAEALAAAEETKRRLSSALTSAPLKAVFGLWMILLGQGMQLWLAVAPLL